MILQNPDLNETYHIRSVPLDEAAKLREQGVIFYDNTKLVAVNTCPTFGVLRYGLHRTETAIGGRNLALECGAACHDFFAALRMWTVIDRCNADSTLNIKQIDDHGIRLFGNERWSSMFRVQQDSDPKDNAIRFALEALHSSGYYDDPNDRKRTLANMEVACLTYTERYFQSDLPVLVRDDFIGVEVPFVIEIGIERLWPNEKGDLKIVKKAYYCGRIDGVHTYGDQIIAAENKTSGRLSDSWRMSFHLSSQVTGYNLALSEILGRPITKSIIMGTQIPVPTRDIYSGVSFEEVSRNNSDFIRWCEWFFHSASMYEMWINDPTHAPRYTHSCNRYFSTCQFLPYCTLDRAEQTEVLEQMRVEEWSPLDHVTEASEGED